MDYSNLPAFVVLTDVGPRDGLQSFPTYIPFNTKIRLIETLISSGVKNIQITSFVSPKIISQFRDAEDVVLYFADKEDLVLSALILNTKGIERALSSGIRAVEISMSANNEFSLKNTNMSKDDALKQVKQILLIASENNLYIRGSIQCCFGYKYSNDVLIEDILEISKIFMEYNVNEIVYADTTSNATPKSIDKFFSYILKYIDKDIISMHYHSKMNMGLINIFCSLEYGISRFDTSFGFLGGCPSLDNAYKNVSTEEADNLLKSLGIETGINPKLLEECAKILNQGL